jgi:Kae1-associated kinase Bud32
VVLKNFTDVRSLKWALLSVWAAAASKFSMSPLARLEREYAMTGALRDAGILVPRIIAVSPDVRILVKEYIGGPTLANVIDELFHGSGSAKGFDAVADYGRLLAVMHRSGFALGDAKSSNVVVSEKGLYLTDLEQADRDGDKAWDLAEFIYYTAKLSTKEDEMEIIARAFLRGYAKEGSRELIEKAGSLKYLRPFQPFVLPGMTKSLRDLMEEFS